MLNWESTEGKFVGVLTCQSVSALLYHEESVICGRLWVEHFQVSLEISNELCMPSSDISFSSSVEISGRMDYRLIQTSTSSCALLCGVCLAGPCKQYVGRCFHQCPIVKDHITILFICQAVALFTLVSMKHVYQNHWKEWADWLLKKVYQTTPFCP